MVGYLRGGSSSRFLLADPHSHDLVHEISHFLSRLLLLLTGGMGVDVRAALDFVQVAVKPAS